MKTAQPTLRPQQATIRPPTGTLKPTQTASALKAAANATLKLPGTQQVTVQAAPGATMRPNLAGVETIWDGDPPATTHMVKLKALGGSVQKMSKTIEGGTMLRQEKARFADEMYRHSLDQVEETRVSTEGKLAELAGHIQDFTDDFEQMLKGMLGEMDKEMQHRLDLLNAEFQVLEAKAKEMERGIEEERISRINDTEQVLGPIRKQVRELTSGLEREEQIRRNRAAELKQKLEEAINRLGEACDVEFANGKQKQEEAVQACTIKIDRLFRRQDEVEASVRSHLDELEKDVGQESKVRAAAQDDVVERITDFIRKFQMHVKEEGDMGN